MDVIVVIEELGDDFELVGVDQLDVGVGGVRVILPFAFVLRLRLEDYLRVLHQTESWGF